MAEGITFISNAGETLPVAWRLLREGMPVSYYIHKSEARGQYAGLMPRIRLDSLPAAIEKSQVVLIDIVQKNTGSDQDVAFLRQFGLPTDSTGLFGKLGDKLRKQYPDKVIIGGGSWPEKMELDREEGVKLARQVGLSIPTYHQFTTLRDGAKFLYKEGKGKKWVFKPHGNADLDLTKCEDFEGELLDLLTLTYPKRIGDKVEFILQEKIDGEELSSSMRFDGEKFLLPHRTLEDKKLNDGNLGPAVGSQSNTIWPCKDMNGIIHREMQGLAPYLKGLCLEVDANCIITKDGKAWFLEWTMREGYSFMFLFLSRVKKGKLSTFFLKKFHTAFDDDAPFVASQVLSLDPFPRVLEKPDFRVMVKNNLINMDIDQEGAWWHDIYQDGDGKLRCAGADGMLGVVLDRGGTAEEAIKNCHKRLAEIKKKGISGDLQHRTLQDHLDSHLGRLEQLKKILNIL